VNLPGVNVQCGMSSRGLIGPFFFEGIIIGLFSRWWWSLQTHTMTLSLSAQEVLTTCHFVPKIVTIKEWVHFLSNFISLQQPPFFCWQNKRHIHRTYISRQCYLDCVGYGLPFVWNETRVHSWTVVYLSLECGHCYLQEREHVVITEARFHNAETLCEVIITQKRFVKK
jgi:hypothetical protein